MCFPLSKSYVNYGSVIFFAVNKHLIKQMIKTTQKKREEDVEKEIENQYNCK